MKRVLIITILVIGLGYILISCFPALTTHGGGLTAPVGEDIANFQTALSMFHVDNGRFPTKEEGLEALIKKPVTIPEGGKWRRYLEAHKLPMDPWGRAYVYEIPGKHNPDRYDLYSLGPNGKGGDEAFGNWSWTVGQRVVVKKLGHVNIVSNWTWNGGELGVVVYTSQEEVYAEPIL